jgi:hypothetical protein
VANPIQLTAVDGSTTIIDGVSDVFKIAVSGTFSVTVGAGSAQSAEVTLSGLGSVSVTPASIALIARDDNTSAALRMSAIEIETNNNSYAVSYAYVNAGQVTVGLLATNLGGSSSHTWYSRWYILLETGM